MRKLFIFAAAFSLMLCGCGGKSDKQVNTEVPSDIINETNDINETDIDHEVQKEQLINLKDYSLQYNVKTDSPRGYDWGMMSASGEGYFFCDYEEAESNGIAIVTYWDNESGVYLPLCSNPDCEHNTQECVALINRNDCDIVSSLYYYDGYVYLCGRDDSGYICLYRIKNDGSEFEKYMALYKDEGSDRILYPELCFHRGYVYYSIPFQSDVKLWRTKIGSSESEIMYEMKGERQNLYRIKAYGDYIFFQAGNFIDTTMMEINAGINALNTVTGEVFYVLHDAIKEYGISGNSLYYSSSNGIDVMDLTDGSRKNLVEIKLGQSERNPNIIFGNSFILVKRYMSSVLNLYDYSGNLIKTINTDGMMSLYGVSDKIIFGVDEKDVYMYYDISGSEEWIKLNKKK